MAANPPQSAVAPAGTADDLGPLVLEQRATHGIAIVYACGGVLFAGMGVLALLIHAAGDRRIDYATAAVFIPVGLLYLIAAVLRFWQWRGGLLALHEHGIRERRGGRESVVRFDDVAEMKYQSTRVFVHGTYAGTVERLSVRTAAAGSRELFFQRKQQEKTGLATGYTEASDVDRVARNISTLLIRRFCERLDRGETVAWTGRMRLRSAGVELARQRWQERSLGGLMQRQPAWQFFTWRQIDRAQLNQGYLTIWVQNQKQPRLRVAAGEVNFRPGYAIFAARLAQAAKADETESAAAVPVLSAQNRAENVTVRFRWNIEDHIARQWHYDRSTPKGRQDWRGRIWIPSGIALFFALLFLFTAWAYGRIGLPWFLLLLLSSVPATLLIATLLHYLLRLSERMRIGKEIRAAHELSKSGKTADPLAEFEVIFGPPGYAYRRSAAGEMQWRWSEIARVAFAGGYIFLHKAGTKLQPEYIELMVPPRAFQHPHAAQAAFERIQDWHARAQRPAG